MDRKLLKKKTTNAEEGRGLLIYIINNTSYSEIIMDQQYCEYLNIYASK